VDGLETGRGAGGVGDARGGAAGGVVRDGFGGAGLTVVPERGAGGVGAGPGDGAGFRAGAAGGGDDGLADGAGERAGAACGGDDGSLAAVDGTDSLGAVGGGGDCEAASDTSADNKTSIEQAAPRSLRPIAGPRRRASEHARRPREWGDGVRSAHGRASSRMESVLSRQVGRSIGACTGLRWAQIERGGESIVTVSPPRYKGRGSRRAPS
jgi:hypothetical protein